VGKASFACPKGMSEGKLVSLASDFEGQGHTVLYASLDGAFAGFVALKDQTRQDADLVLKELKALGLGLVLATGDNAAAAKLLGSELGISKVEAGLSPQGKAMLVARLKSEGRKVAMLGDGVNDAVALAAADVGIAMGSGSDVAIQSAGITLLKGDLKAMLRARRLSLASMANIKLNLFWAFAYNALGIPVAAGLLYPWLGILLSPMLAALAMSFSSVTVIVNALRLRSLKL
jgi:Cu+-exporting ATPase